MISADKFVAHRGDMGRFPENTLPALQAAIEVGARYVEFDVQLASDLTPVVFHDANLQRMTGMKGIISDYTAEALSRIHVDRATHTNDQCIDATIPTLLQTIELLNVTPSITAFVELKRYSVNHFGLEHCVDMIADIMSTARFAWVLISFHADALHYAKARYARPVGWVLTDHSRRSHGTALGLSPEYLFFDVKCLPPVKQVFWPGAWKWVVYDISEITQATALLGKGADLIETGRISELLLSARSLS